MGFFCFASFYMKPFFGAILKSPKWQEIALNISESSKRRTPDPPFLFIAYTMQSLPACLNINQAGGPRGSVPNLHCTCIFSIRRKALLGEKMERKSLPRIRSLPRAHPVTAAWCNEQSQWFHDTLDFPCLSDLLKGSSLYPLHTSPSFTFKWASANTVRESFCSCGPSRYKRGWVMCAICSFYLQVCMKNVSGKFWADGSESYGFFTNFGKYSIPFFVFWQEPCISYTSL